MLILLLELEHMLTRAKLLAVLDCLGCHLLNAVIAKLFNLLDGNSHTSHHVFDLSELSVQVLLVACPVQSKQTLELGCEGAEFRDEGY